MISLIGDDGVEMIEEFGDEIENATNSDLDSLTPPRNDRDLQGMLLSRLLFLVSIHIKNVLKQLNYYSCKKQQ